MQEPLRADILHRPVFYISAQQKAYYWAAAATTKEFPIDVALVVCLSGRPLSILIDFGSTSIAVYHACVDDIGSVATHAKRCQCVRGFGINYASEFPFNNRPTTTDSARWWNTFRFRWHS